MNQPPRRRRILIVDDSPTALLATSRALRVAGYEVITSDNPIITPTLIRREVPDLLLLDVEMPALSGDTVAAIVRQTASRLGSRQVGILLHSTKSAADLERLVASSGADGYIEKGLSSAELVKQVDAWFGGGARRRNAVY
jgi:CheY-like chemotaxis protein